MNSPYRGRQWVGAAEPAPDPNRPGLLQTWTSTRACPVCSVVLFAARQHGIRIEACSVCGGCWMPNDAAQQMLESTVAASVAAELAAKADSHASAPPAASGPCICPDCGAILEPTTVAMTELDVCRLHGTWFDRWELSAMVRRLVPDPGEADVVLPEDMLLHGIGYPTGLDAAAALLGSWPYRPHR